jgi:DnaJ domain
VEQIEAYPLCWPSGYTRTATYERAYSQFKQTYDKAQRFMHKEVERLRATDLIVSTNLRVRKDGYLYADELNRKIDDPGVAIYFQYKKKPVSMCCDKYTRIWENMYALGKGIEALRGMERWGVSDFLDRAFTGFTALPGPIQMMDCWTILGLSGKPASIDLVRAAYVAMAKIHHPDTSTGSVEAFQELQEAYETALRHF